MRIRGAALVYALPKFALKLSSPEAFKLSILYVHTPGTIEGVEEMKIKVA